MTGHPPIDSSAFKQFERDGFDRVAEGYDRAIAKVTSKQYATDDGIEIPASVVLAVASKPRA